MPNTSSRCRVCLWLLRLAGAIGINVGMAAEATADAPDWEALPPTFYLRSAPSDKVAAVPHDQSSEGAPIQLLDKTTAVAQTWTLSFLTDGSVAIRNVAHAKVFDIANGSEQDAAVAHIATYRDTPSQRWALHDAGGGRVTVVNQHSGKCLAVLGERNESGAPVGQWTCNGNTHQQWRISPADMAGATPAPVPVPGRTVGIYYGVWHWPAWTYMNEARTAGRLALSIESVLRSRQENGASVGPGYTFAQIHDAPFAADALDFYYQYDPQPGFYCIYHRRRLGAVNYDAAHEGTYGRGNKPDCPMYKAILEQHARALNALGVDFVFADMTRGSGDDPMTDALQTRPFEVLLEQWQALRAAGQPTPGAAAWQRLPPMPAHPQDGNTYALHRVLAAYNDPAHSEAVMRDPASGKKLFLYRGSEATDPGWVAFIESNGGRNDVVAIAMGKATDTQWCAADACRAGAHLNDDACNQPMTPHSKLGSQSSVTPTYQSPLWASLPFDTVGVHDGLTLEKQFWSALAQSPNWLLVYGWNEQIAQALPAAPGSPASMGFETDSTIGNKAFVESYGVEYTRDIEPTQAYGTRMYDLTQSCLRLYRQGHAGCDDANELCCRGGNFSAGYRYYASSAGVFELYAPDHAGGNTRLLYECRQGAHTFVSTDAYCDGYTGTDILGRIGRTRGGFTLRPLYSCMDAFGALYESLSGTCAGGHLQGILGYVR